MKRSDTSFGIRWLGVGVMTLLLSAFLLSAAHSQVARVASLQRTVEKRGGGGAWQKVGAGANLGLGDSVRTGKRSKVDLKFADGSLLRLGQLSSVTFQSAKGVRLTGGQVLYAALRPGRILAGTGAAEIKGSVVLAALDESGDATFTLSSGAADITAGGQTVSLQPGTQVTARLDNTISAPSAALPLGTGPTAELSEPASEGPQTGSLSEQTNRESSDRAAVDQTVPQANPEVTGGGDGGGGGGFTPPAPFPTPFPTLAPGDAPTLRAANSPNSSPRRWSVSLPERALLQLDGTSNTLARQSTLSLSNTRYAQVLPAPNAPAAGSPATDSPAIEAPAIDVAINELPFDLDIRPALRHIEETERGKGKTLGGDASLITAFSDGGVSVYGARLRGFGAVGNFYFEGTLLPLRLRAGGVTRDLSSIANLFLRYRDTRGDIQIGRQRFVSGPTQSSLFGSLVRQGGRETMDAIRVTPKLSGGKQLELAYIYDAFPRNLPFQISGPQKALYARAALRRKFGNFGVNAFKYTSAPVSNTTGITFDFAVPLVRDQVEIYGEAGRDAFRRRLTTLGLAFPGLFERTDFDAYLEYANLGSSAGVAAPPSEATLRVYRSVNRHVSAVTALSHFGRGVGWNFTIGLSLGGSAGSRNGG